MARKSLLILFLTLIPPIAGADSLEEALHLVLAVSPVLTERTDALHAIERQSSWASQVRIGYAAKGTDNEAEGLNARLDVVIPLFDRKREIEVAKAREQVAATQQDLISAFLTDVQRLDELRAKQAETEEMTAFYKDQLAYHQKLEQEGQIDAAVLWVYAEKAKLAEHTARQAAADYRITLERVARQYGGAQWERLATLLAAHGKRTPY